MGICVPEAELPSSKTHCGARFVRCLGAGVCTDGACEGTPAPGRCVLSRGNFDCPGGQGCVEDADPNDGEGDCVEGALGDGKSGEGCDRGEDCEGGLCVDGLCARPCDFGCPLGTTCDDEAIPGGLCVPSDEELCR